MNKEKDKPVSDLFRHVQNVHEDLSLPADSHESTDEVAWGYQMKNFNPSTSISSDKNLDHERLQSLAILDKKERMLFAREYVIAKAYGIRGSLDLIEQLEILSIAVKGQGRKDAKEIIGGIKQTVNAPTTMQRVRKVFRGRGGKEQETEVEYGGDSDS